MCQACWSYSVVDINLTKRSRFLPRNSLLDLLKSFYPRLHMRYQFGGVVQIKTNLMTFNSLVSIHSLVSIDCGFLIQLVFCKKKNYVVYWCWSRARDECAPSLRESWIRPCWHLLMYVFHPIMTVCHSIITFGIKV